MSEKFGIKSKDIELKKSLIKAKNIIKKKFKDLYEQRLALDERVNEEYKPIIEPLRNLVNKTAATQQSVIIKKEENKRKRKQSSVKAKSQLKSESQSDSNAPKSYHRLAVNTSTPLLGKELFPSSSNSSENNDDVDYIDEEKDEEDEEEEDNATFAGVPSTSGNASANSMHTSRTLRPSSKKVQQIIRSALSTSTSPLRPLTPSDKSNNYYTVQSNLEMNEMRLGKSRVTMSDGLIKISTKKFKSTPGLLELLLMSRPQKTYTQHDLLTYKKMLEFTNAHRKGYLPSGAVVRDSTNPKYVNIIQQLFPLKHGGGGSRFCGTKRKRNMLQTNYMTLNNNNKRTKTVNYTYWDNPNELVERLKLLVASQEAGHNGHNNEIISIIEELREANIIV